MFSLWNTVASCWDRFSDNINYVIIASPYDTDPQKRLVAIRRQRWLIAISIWMTFLFNGLASSAALPWLAPLNPGEVSDRNLSLLTPAGYAFGIWGLIYALLAAYSIYQLLPRTFDDQVINRAIGSNLVIFNSLLNCTWVVVWGNDLTGVGLIVILLLLVNLAWIYWKLSLVDFRYETKSDDNVDDEKATKPGSSKNDLDDSDSDEKGEARGRNIHGNASSSIREWVRWLCIYPAFSVYFAWVLVASILNIFAVFGTYNSIVNINGDNSQSVERVFAGSVVGLVAAWLLESMISWLPRRRTLNGPDGWVSGTGAWALLAVGVKNMEQASKSPSPLLPQIATMAYVFGGLLAFQTVVIIGMKLFAAYKRWANVDLI